VIQVVTILLMELAILPVAHGYFLHMCAWPLVHTHPVIRFGISFALLHWLLGMVRLCHVLLYLHSFSVQVAA
jgi:hypothetical protein